MPFIQIQNLITNGEAQGETEQVKLKTAIQFIIVSCINCSIQIQSYLEHGLATSLSCHDKT